MDNNIEREIGWDEEISKESDEFILLPAGDYDFTVSDFERARHAGSTKLPPCNKAIITLKIETPEGTAYVKHNLFLHTKTEGMLSAFFIAIGQKKHGEPLRMNWSTVIGSKGRCKVDVREWTGNDGEVRKSNEIKKFYEPSQNNTATAPSGVFTPGRF